MRRVGQLVWLVLCALSAAGAARAEDRVPTNDNQLLSASVLETLRNRLATCWNVPTGVREAPHLVVTVQIKLNRDGSLAGEPSVVNASPDPLFQTAAASALRAARACAPFDFLPRDKYEVWRDIIVDFDPHEMAAPRAPAAIPQRVEHLPVDATNPAGPDDAIAEYGRLVVDRLAAQKRFPGEAVQKKMEGTARVLLVIDRNGRLVSSRLLQSSGYDILDREALAQIERSQPFPAPPTTLAGEQFTFTLPIRFRIK